MPAGFQIALPVDTCKGKVCGAGVVRYGPFVHPFVNLGDSLGGWFLLGAVMCKHASSAYEKSGRVRPPGLMLNVSGPKNSGLYLFAATRAALLASAGCDP